MERYADIMAVLLHYFMTYLYNSHIMWLLESGILQYRIFCCRLELIEGNCINQLISISCLFSKYYFSPDLDFPGFVLLGWWGLFEFMYHPLCFPLSLLKKTVQYVELNKSPINNNINAIILYILNLLVILYIFNSLFRLFYLI